MDAARESSLETIDVLLRLGADPNILDNDSRSALWFALYSNNLATVKKLLPVSSKGLEGVFQQFSKSSILFSEEVKYFIRNKLDEKPSLILNGLNSSSEFGHVPMLVVIKDFLKETFRLNGVYGNAIKIIFPQKISNAIKSDGYEACQVVKDICELQPSY